MRKGLFAISVLIILIGCDVPEKDIAIVTLQKQNDSLRMVIQQDSILKENLSAKIKQQRTLILFTRAKCQRYAAIVKRKPSQSVFIENWIKRSFQWVDESENPTP